MNRQTDQRIRIKVQIQIQINMKLQYMIKVASQITGAKIDVLKIMLEQR